MYKDDSEKITKLFRRINIDFIEINTGKPYINYLLNFFRLRGKRK